MTGIWSSNENADFDSLDDESVLAQQEAREAALEREEITRGTGGRCNDVIRTNHGSLILFMLLTPRAEEWVENNVQDEAQFFGSSLVVEPRYAADLTQGMSDAGLEVA